MSNIEFLLKKMEELENILSELFNFQIMEWHPDDWIKKKRKKVKEQILYS